MRRRATVTSITPLGRRVCVALIRVVAEAMRRVMLRWSAGPLRPVWRLVYGLCARIVGAYLRRGRLDCAVYALGGWRGDDAIYGISDIDIVVVVHPAPGRPGEIREAILARWERVCQALPPLRELLHVAAYEYRDLEPYVVDSPSLSFVPPAGRTCTDAPAGPRSFNKPPDVSLRAGLGLPRSAWRLLDGTDRLPPSPRAEQYEPRISAWLELQYWWRYAFTACLNPNGPRTPYTCVKLLAEPVRIWIWLTHGEVVSNRHEALRRGLDELPDEREALERALALKRELHRSPDPPLAEILAAFVRLSARIAKLLAAEIQDAGSTDVRLTWGGEQELAVAAGLRDALRSALGAEPRLLPLADWRALLYPSPADETFALVPGSPADPLTVAAMAAAAHRGPYPALREDGLLVLPTPAAKRAKLRAVHCPLSDPVAFALIEGADAAGFPNLGGWSIQETAARAAAAHRAWLGWSEGEAPSLNALVRLFAAARAALLLESVEAGAPELSLTMGATAAALGTRHPPAQSAAEESYQSYVAWCADEVVPPAGTVARLRDRIVELPAYRRTPAASGPPRPQPAAATFAAVRMGAGPIIKRSMPGLRGRRGASINGPSLIRVPDWVGGPLGRYYLYFAHHHGRDIRLAFADRLAGPWTVHPHGVLELEDTAAREHIASPDVHVDHDHQQLRMYFHGCGPHGPGRQVSFLATSGDGLRFTASPQVLAPFYLRVFEHRGWYYGLAKLGNRSGLLLRSPDGVMPFEEGPAIIPRMRHAAVLKDGKRVWLFYSRIGDVPESLMAARLELEGDWTTWSPTPGSTILSPNRSYEGAAKPLEPSRPGRARGPRRELRDPAVYVETGRTFLLYSVAGEQGIAIAELQPA
jgi:hypothetical protein